MNEIHTRYFHNDWVGPFASLSLSDDQLPYVIFLKLHFPPAGLCYLKHNPLAIYGYLNLNLI